MSLFLNDELTHIIKRLKRLKNQLRELSNEDERRSLVHMKLRILESRIRRNTKDSCLKKDELKVLIQVLKILLNFESYHNVIDLTLNSP